MFRDNGHLLRMYSAAAPLYDTLTSRLTARARARSIARAAPGPGERVLIVGVGTGQDLPYLSRDAVVTAIDLTAPMLARARTRAEALGLAVDFRVGDAMALDLPDGSFDVVLLHLIVAVVPDARRALAEAVRVVRVGGRLALYDKFVRRDSGPLLRALNVVTRAFGTGVDTCLEELLEQEPRLAVRATTNPERLFRRVLLERVR